MKTTYASQIDYEKCDHIGREDKSLNLIDLHQEGSH